MRTRAFVFFFVLAVVKSQETLLELSENMKTDHDAITNAVTDIISSFYLQTTSVLNILIEHSFDCDHHFMFTDTLSKTLHLIDSRVTVVIEESKDLNNRDWKAAYNVLFVDSYTSFKKIFVKLNSVDFNLQGYFLIVITSSEHWQTRDMNLIFVDLWSKYIVNVNIIQDKGKRANECNMFTYFPFSESYCEKVHPVLINTFRVGVGFIKSAEHFPNKVRNLYQCPVSVVTFDVPPFMILKKDKNNNTIDISGFDGLFIKSLSKHMNFTLEKIILKRTAWGRMFMNGSATGAIKMIMNQEVNMSIGYFTSSAIRNMFMSSTNVYYTSNLVWVIGPGQSLTSFQRFHKPFQSEIWFFISLTFVISIVVISIIKCQKREVRNFVFGRNVKNPILNMTNVLLGGPMIILPKQNFARFLLTLFLIYTLVIRNAYTGALFRFLQLDARNEKVKNMDEMLKQNYRFLVLDAVKEYVEYLPRISERSITMWYSQFERNRTLLLTSDNKITMLASEDHVSYWNKKISSGNFFNTFKEKLSAINLVLYLHRTSCLTPELSRNILNFNSNGLLQIFKQNFIDKAYLKPKLLDSEPKKLTLSNLSGAFYIILIGVILATICFLLELIIHLIIVLRKRRLIQTFYFV